jgi:hypothetical protein
MLYVHHVPQADAADNLSKLISAIEVLPVLPVSGHVRDTDAESEASEDAEGAPIAELSQWARLDSNQGPTDYESAALTRLSYGPGWDRVTPFENGSRLRTTGRSAE